MTTYTQESPPAGGGSRALGGLEGDGAAPTGVAWPAIFAGATAAAALSLIMLLLGTGMGLGIASPWDGEGAQGKTIGIAGVFWITFTQIAASGLGGYLAGRLRTKWSGVRTEEARFRDTAHGFLAWGVATLVTSALLASVIGSTVSAGARAGMGMASSIATGAAGAAAASRPGQDETGGVGQMGYWVDSLFRKEPGAPPASTGQEAGGSAQSAEAGNATSTAEMTRIFSNSLRTGTLPAEDGRYAAQVVAQRTGLSQQDAEKRVNETYARAKSALEEARNKAKAAADMARKATAYGSLWIFISLVIGALVAAYCATVGGRHRDL